MSQPDPILEEIRAIRDAIALEGGQDLRKIAAAASLREKEGGRKVVRLPPKRPRLVQKAS